MKSAWLRGSLGLNSCAVSSARLFTLFPNAPPHASAALSAVVSKWCQTTVRRPPNPTLFPRIRRTYAVYGRVTDGARTRDLRSHNPMLYLLSYGHQARMGFYQRKAAWQSAVCSRILCHTGFG